MADPILPTADEMLTAAIDEIVALRPESLKHFNNPNSRWNDLPAIWRAQVLLNLNRLADEVKSARLRFAKGDALRALCASEFNTTLTSAPQTALATINLARPVPSETLVCAAPVSPGNTTISFSPALTIAIPASTTLQWSNGSVFCTLTSQANIGATSLSVGPMSASIPVGTTTSYSSQAAAPAGVIRKGTQFTKVSRPDGVPVATTSPSVNSYPLPVSAAVYTTLQTVYVPQGTLSATVIASAVTAGAAANVPTFSNYSTPTLIQSAKPLYDPTFAVSSCEASGGSSGLTDPVLVAAARAYAIGQFGPTDGAILAGCLRQQSVRHFAAFRASNTVDYAQVYVADESWGSGALWTSQVAQTVASDWIGFGCRARFGTIVNQQIAVSAAISLRSTDDLNFTDDIDSNVRTSVEAYFNDRSDWYRWRSTTLKAVISKADPRVLKCTSVTVTDAVTGAAVPEPANTFGLEWSDTLTHYYATDANVTSVYSPPS